MNTKITQKDERAKLQAQSQYNSIIDMLNRYDKAEGKDDKQDEIRVEIEENVLSAEIIKNYQIMLCWGGPAVKIFGDLNEHNEPETAQLQYQDWFTGWIEYFETDEDKLLDYARFFYFDAN